jgi:hypothetical protein
MLQNKILFQSAKIKYGVQKLLQVNDAYDISW